MASSDNGSPAHVRVNAYFEDRSACEDGLEGGKADTRYGGCGNIAEERSAHHDDMTEFVPSYGEELEGIDDDSRSGDVPKGKDDHCVDTDLDVVE